MSLRIITFLFACFCLSAQDIVFLQLGQWVDGKFVRGPIISDGYNVIDFKEGLISRRRIPYAPLPGGQEYPKYANRSVFNEETKRYDMPKVFIDTIGQSQIFFVNGEAYSVVRGGKTLVSFRNADEPADDNGVDSKGDTQTKEIVPAMELVSFINGEWCVEASLKTDSMGIILPLSNGNYLAGLRNGHIVDEDKRDPNPFGIYKKNNRGNLTLVSTIDLEDYGIWGAEVGIAPTNIAITDGYYTFISNQAGMIWTFSSYNGRLVRSRTLYPDVLEALKSNKKVVPVITCAQPTVSGEILFSAWSSKLCVEGGGILGRMQQAERGHQIKDVSDFVELEKIKDKMRYSIIEIDPIVRWYRYDPATGQLTQEPIGPKGSRDIILSGEDFLKYKDWLIDEDGTEVFYVKEDKLLYLTPNQQIKLSESAEPALPSENKAAAPRPQPATPKPAPVQHLNLNKSETKYIKIRNEIVALGEKCIERKSISNVQLNLYNNNLKALQKLEDTGNIRDSILSETGEIIPPLGEQLEDILKNKSKEEEPRWTFYRL